MAEITKAGGAAERQFAKARPDLRRFYEEVEGGSGVSGLGGEHAYLWLLGLEPGDTTALVERVEEGFPYQVLESFIQNVDVTRERVANLVQIRPRTLDRRKAEGRLHPDESDRLLRVCRTFGRAIELFEWDVEAAKEWLSSSQRALGGSVPLRMAKTEIGAREVEALIGRLEHGVFS